MRLALRCYRSEAPAIRLFVLLRHLLAPLERIAREVPAAGEILDVGCGHGLFANLLALQSSDRLVLGLDPSKAKIEVARRSGRGLPNVRYLLGHVEDVEQGRFAAITILDVLYLLPNPEKLALLRHCRRLIAPGGRLLVKTNDTSPAWRFAVTAAQEKLMVGLGLTHADGPGLYFRSANENRALLREAGFESETLDLSSWLPYPHKLFVASPRTSYGANGSRPS
jgi:2-polyprenyl-6-hydroxyphenyl methylase/3-demethylubiquinone-9 3-methyltransferase